MEQNPELVLQNISFFLFTWYGSAVILTSTLFLAFFRKQYIINFSKIFFKPLIYSSIISLIFLNTYPFLQKFWYSFSSITANTAHAILNLFYPTQIKFSANVPTLILPNFRAAISAPCSGIEGLTLFVFLFTLLFLVDWKFINKKKAIFLYIIGMAGTILINILRITALFLIGQIHSPQLAVGFFHSNAGWILFSAYFVIFEFITYDWLRKKNEK